MTARVRVYIACSLDGFIAGPDGDLSWLPPIPEEADEDLGWGAFISDIGCLLMGRATYDAVRGMTDAWPHAERATLVATHRPLPDPPPRVRHTSGPIGEVVDLALALAEGKDVYIDGGDLIRQALDAGRVDELIVTVCPVILGAGHPLFAGATRRHILRLVSVQGLPGGLVQMTHVVERPA